MNRLLQQWLTDQAQIQPNSTAIVDTHKSMTYEELEKESNRLAHMLKEQGCTKGDRICFFMPKSSEAILSIMGILKSDCIYVPLDTESPPIRTAKIILKSRPKFILASGNVEESLRNILREAKSDQEIRIGWLGNKEDISKASFYRENLQACSAEVLDYKHQPEDPAHILFTSGSTGEPKGVITTHANDIAFIEWAKSNFDIQPEDRLSSHPPLHFDMSSFDIYGSIASGAQLHLVPPQYNIVPNQIANFIREREITQWFSVPSILNYMAKFKVVQQNDFPSLKRLVWCGEKFPTPPLRYWMRQLPHVSFTNLYGPTETTIASSYYTVPEIPESDHSEVPIGKACEGEKLHILDEEMQAVPNGEKGFLYISGAGVSPGYWEDPERTENVFRSNPYSTSNNDEIIYMTGDLASIGKEGLCYFHGREDHQIKSRGYRIELGEIESALSSLNLFLECAVVALEVKGFEGKSLYCAYVSLSGNKIDVPQMREKLSELIPSYMIPQGWKKFQSLPKNKNGKIDRNELSSNFQNNEIKANT